MRYFPPSMHNILFGDNIIEQHIIAYPCFQMVSCGLKYVYFRLHLNDLNRCLMPLPPTWIKLLLVLMELQCLNAPLIAVHSLIRPSWTNFPLLNNITMYITILMCVYRKLHDHRVWVYLIRQFVHFPRELIKSRFIRTLVKITGQFSLVEDIYFLLVSFHSY